MFINLVLGVGTILLMVRATGAEPTAPPAPAPPTDLVATATGPTGVALTWGQVGTTVPGVTAFRDRVTAPGAAYTYRVRAVGAGNSADSAPSEAATATAAAVPPDVAPTGFGATTVDPNDGIDYPSQVFLS